MSHLQRRPSGIYVARLAIPTRLQPIVGQREFVETTGTRSRAEATVIAAVKLARWRQHLSCLDGLLLPSTPMDHDGILKIAYGHPILNSGGYLPIAQAAAASGIGVSDLLREAVDGRLDLFVRLTTQRGYVTPVSAFEPDDWEWGTVNVPTLAHMPEEGRRHVASGVFKFPGDELSALASHLLTRGSVAVVAFELPDDPSMAFVPDNFPPVGSDQVEVLAAAVEKLRAKLAAGVAAGAVDAARAAQESKRTAPVAAEKKAASRLLSEAIDAFRKHELSRTILSSKEIDRIGSAISLLVEFEGDVPVGDVDPDMLRHFRDEHLSRMPAKENQVRLKYGTSSMRESVEAIAGTDWPVMSADERDLRMKWICRMFGWLHRQKWISDDPSTGLRRESVLTKAQRAKAEAGRKDREEFTPEEFRSIFSRPWFARGAGLRTKEGTYREFQPFHFWLPLLGAYSGGRIGELTQLYLDDVACTEAGTWFIDINRKTLDKSLKNDWSVRRVPLHAKLVELGFPEWCQRLRQEGYQRVFPELSWNPTNRYGKEPIRFMSQLLQDLGMPRDGTKVFHSFRHGMNNNLQKHSAMPDIMRKRLMGHEPGEGVNERSYLSDPTPDAMAVFVNALALPLPEVGAFGVEAGLGAVRDALRRKSRGRGASESLGCEHSDE